MLTASLLEVNSLISFYPKLSNRDAIQLQLVLCTKRPTYVAALGIWPELVLRWRAGLGAGQVTLLASSPRLYTPIEASNSGCCAGEKHETHTGKEGISLIGLGQLVQTCSYFPLVFCPVLSLLLYMSRGPTFQTRGSPRPTVSGKKVRGAFSEIDPMKKRKMTAGRREPKSVTKENIAKEG